MFNCYVFCSLRVRWFFFDNDNVPHQFFLGQWFEIRRRKFTLCQAFTHRNPGQMLLFCLISNRVSFILIWYEAYHNSSSRKTMVWDAKYSEYNIAKCWPVQTKTRLWSSKQPLVKKHKLVKFHASPRFSRCRLGNGRNKQRWRWC